jgi:hypothetical protein
MRLTIGPGSKEAEIEPIWEPDRIFLNLFESEGLVSRHFLRVSEGTRTPDRLDHNQELYQLSYAHHGALESTSAGLF